MTTQERGERYDTVWHAPAPLPGQTFRVLEDEWTTELRHVRHVYRWEAVPRPGIEEQP